MNVFRIVSDLGRSYLLSSPSPLPATVSGRLLHRQEDPAERPTVGDWVNVRVAGELAVIDDVLPRRTALWRRAAGGDQRQVLAANVDLAVIVTAVGADFSPRRVERFVALAHEGGIEPLIAVNKIDRAKDPEECLASLAEVGRGLHVVLLSALEGRGVPEIAARLADGRTAVLVGSSGVGKSTLANVLLGRPLQATHVVRDDDDKGRHTTTRRELFEVPSGGYLIDTPGIRELGLVDAANGVADAFGEIAALAEGCRFRDCTHEQEPGCAVREAVDPARLDAWRRLLREQAYLARREDPRAMAREKSRWKVLHRAARERDRQKRGDS